MKVAGTQPDGRQRRPIPRACLSRCWNLVPGLPPALIGSRQLSRRRKHSLRNKLGGTPCVSGARIYRFLRPTAENCRLAGHNVFTMSWERLGDAVRDRRTTLGMTQGEVSDRGGPSVETLRAIENNRAGRLSPRMRRALERALEWGTRKHRRGDRRWGRDSCPD